MVVSVAATDTTTADYPGDKVTLPPATAALTVLVALVSCPPRRIFSSVSSPRALALLCPRATVSQCD